MAEGSTPKRSEDDCDMVTSLQEPFMSKAEQMLHEAARTGRIERLKQLLKTGVKVDCRNNLDRTALHMAASKDQVGAVKVLIEQKASIDLSDKYGMTPIMWAAYFGHEKIAEILIDKAANIRRRNKLGMHVLHIAAESGHPKLVQLFLLKTKRAVLNDVEKNGQTALMLAAGKGHVEVIEVLLAYPEIQLLHEDSKKKTAFHLAAESGNPTVLNILIEKLALSPKKGGWDVEDEAGYKPLHYAVENGHVGTIKCLLKHKSDPNALDKKSMTPFLLAARQNNQEVMKILQENGADVLANNSAGDAALHLAVMNNDASEIYKLVHLGCETAHPNSRMQTALHLAVEQNRPNAAEALLLCGAPLDARDKNGKTPLLLATRCSYVILVDMIIKAERLREKTKRRQLRGATVKRRDDLHAAEPTALVDEMDDNGAVFKPADYENRININEEIQREIEQPDDEFVSVEKALRTGEQPTYRLLEFNQVYAEEFKQYLWKLAFKHLRHTEWMKLARHWGFWPEFIEAIQHQHTGETSYKQHGYRVLCIWFHGMEKQDTPIRELYEALVQIGRRPLAEKVRRQLDRGAEYFDAGKRPHKRCLVQ